MVCRCGPCDAPAAAAGDNMMEEQPIELRIGGLPHAYAGSQNSSGYAHTVEVEDESVIAYRSFRGDPPDPRLCGASTDITFQFWPLQPGTSKVTVRFGRSWDPSTLEVRAEYSFVVLEDMSGVAAAMTMAEARLTDLKAAAAAKGLSLPEQQPQDEEGSSSAAPSAAAGDATSPGPKLFSMAVEIGRFIPVFKQHARQEKHASALAKVRGTLAVPPVDQASGRRPRVTVWVHLHLK